MASLLSFLVITLAAAATSNASRFGKIPSLNPTQDSRLMGLRWSSTAEDDDDANADMQTLFYNQTLDHFNYAPQSYATFQQRYVVDSRHFSVAAAAAPVLVYLGAEAPLDNDLLSIGFLRENGARFGALLVYIEHRFYGKSIPEGRSYVEDNELRGYFNSAQALADYAEIILQVKQDFKAHDSPVIVIGGSYGGMLASWFRLKYPHIALGALASSAPILYFDDITSSNGYYDLVTKDFREVSETCYKNIKKSWTAIQEIATLQDGLSLLSHKFKTCKPLNNSSELIDYLESLYASAAQYNDPLRNPVAAICRGIEGARVSATTVSNDDKRPSPLLSKIFAGVVAIDGVKQCYVNPPKVPSETAIGWRWQTCSEMVIPIGIGNNTMFPSNPFDLTVFRQQCQAVYGVPPRPHWVTTFYGGHSIKLVLKRFGSNIIFSNGLKDPYSSGG
ncbi:Lysosomal Pro-X carboxypeptidase [Linum grandiflorum]